MFDPTDLDSRMACIDVRPEVCTQETGEAPVDCWYTDGHDPDWYMEMPDSIRCEFESADRYTTD